MDACRCWRLKVERTHCECICSALESYTLFLIRSVKAPVSTMNYLRHEAC